MATSTSRDSLPETARPGVRGTGLVLACKSLGSVRVRIAICLSLVLSLAGCGAAHTTDARLEELFRAKEREFADLLAMLEQDAAIRAISSSYVVTKTRIFELESSQRDRDEVPLSKERLAQYRELFIRLRLTGGAKKGLGNVEFEVDRPALANGDARKGILYSVAPLPSHPGGLDGYQLAEADRVPGIGYKRLQVSEATLVLVFVRG